MSKRYVLAAELCRDEPHTVLELAAALRCDLSKARNAVNHAKRLHLLRIVGKVPSGHVVYSAGSVMEDRR